MREVESQAGDAETTMALLTPVNDRQNASARQSMEDFRRTTARIRYALADRQHSDSAALVREDRER